MSLSIQTVTKTFGRNVVLNDISLEIGEGRLVALLGPSGSGKTTLLRIIAGLDFADAQHGRISFHGEDVTERNAFQRGAGFVFQSYALFNHMTVAKNIGFGLRVQPRSKRPPRHEIDARVKDLLGRIQLPDLGHRYPSQLSGGQRQRVALARALAVNPQVLLLDEPFGALDARVRKDLRRWLRDFLEETNVTTLFVTHDQDEAFELADQVVLLHNGTIQQVGTPAQLRAEPANDFVADFLDLKPSEGLKKKHRRLDKQPEYAY